MEFVATALLTGFSRPDNLERIIQSLREQSADIEIFLALNQDDKRQYDVDLQITASKNLMCLPRWFMANYAKSPFVFSLDDDLIFNDPDVVKDCINFAIEKDCGLGGYGVQLKSTSYWRSLHAHLPIEDVPVDIIKGRFLFTHKKFLAGMPMFHEHLYAESPRFEDDIAISSLIPRKIIPAFLRGRIQELPPGNFSLWQQSDHRQSREKAAAKWFPSS